MLLTLRAQLLFHGLTERGIARHVLGNLTHSQLRTIRDLSFWPISHNYFISLASRGDDRFFDLCICCPNREYLTIRHSHSQ